MTFAGILLGQIKGMFPTFLYWFVFPLVPFAIAEQLWPVGEPPRLRDYGMSLLVSLTTVFLSLPLGIAAGLWSGQVYQWLPWQWISFDFSDFGAIPVAGGALTIMAMILVPLLVHDMWFYWSHRLMHKVPVLWEFHRIHHSDERINSSTWARDHFLQQSWNTFFSLFTLGLVVDLGLSEAGQAALYSTMFLVGMSMFYHSAIRIQLPWLDRVLVTPQVHRIHHSLSPEHHNSNFADALPIFDMLFGTYCRPAKDEFPETGLGTSFPSPRSVWSAQTGPVLAMAQTLTLKRHTPTFDDE